jgi:hypothetical protein
MPEKKSGDERVLQRSSSTSSSDESRNKENALDHMESSSSTSSSDESRKKENALDHMDEGVLAAMSEEADRKAKAIIDETKAPAVEDIDNAAAAAMAKDADPEFINQMISKSMLDEYFNEKMSDNKAKALIEKHLKNYVPPVVPDGAGSCDFLIAEKPSKVTGSQCSDREIIDLTEEDEKVTKITTHAEFQIDSAGVLGIKTENQEEDFAPLAPKGLGLAKFGLKPAAPKTVPAAQEEVDVASPQEGEKTRKEVSPQEGTASEKSGDSSARAVPPAACLPSGLSPGFSSRKPSFSETDECVVKTTTPTVEDESEVVQDRIKKNNADKKGDMDSETVPEIGASERPNFGIKSPKSHKFDGGPKPAGDKKAEEERQRIYDTLLTSGFHPDHALEASVFGNGDMTTSVLRAKILGGQLQAPSNFGKRSRNEDEINDWQDRYGDWKRYYDYFVHTNKTKSGATFQESLAKLSFRRDHPDDVAKQYGACYQWVARHHFVFKEESNVKGVSEYLAGILEKRASLSPESLQADMLPDGWQYVLQISKKPKPPKKKKEWGDWVGVAKSLLRKKELGLFAARVFSKDSVIGAFVGQSIWTAETPGSEPPDSAYLVGVNSPMETRDKKIRNSACVYEVVRPPPFDSRGGNQLFLGAHFIINPHASLIVSDEERQDHTKAINAYITEDGLVLAKRKIEKWTEIYVGSTVEPIEFRKKRTRKKAPPKSESKGKNKADDIKNAKQEGNDTMEDDEEQEDENTENPGKTTRKKAPPKSEPKGENKVDDKKNAKQEGNNTTEDDEEQEDDDTEIPDEEEEEEEDDETLSAKSKHKQSDVPSATKPLEKKRKPSASIDTNNVMKKPRMDNDEGDVPVTNGKHTRF